MSRRVTVASAGIEPGNALLPRLLRFTLPTRADTKRTAGLQVGPKFLGIYPAVVKESHGGAVIIKGTETRRD